MKRLIAFICLSLMMVAIFTGCNPVKTVEDEAATMMTDVSEAMSDMMPDNNTNNGTVTDDDGYIDENDQNTSSSSTNATNSTNHSYSTSSTTASDSIV